MMETKSEEETPTGWTTKEVATLIAAAIAAVAALWSARVSDLTAESVATLNALYVEQQANREFKKEQVRVLSSTAFESAILLNAKFETLTFVASIAAADIADLHEFSITHITTISYSYKALKKMGAIGDVKTGDSEHTEEDDLEKIDALLKRWHGVASPLFAYNDLVKKGEILPTGHATTPAAKKAEKDLIEAMAKMKVFVGDLKDTVTNVHASIVQPKISGGEANERQ